MNEIYVLISYGYVTLQHSVIHGVYTTLDAARAQINSWNADAGEDIYNLTDEWDGETEEYHAYDRVFKVPLTIRIEFYEVQS